MHGERTPLIISNPSVLTRRGYQQLHSQGAVFRSRYLVRSDDDEDDGHDGDFAPIVDLDSESINTSHLKVASSGDRDIAEGALAFMQGLYPPLTQASCHGTRNVQGPRDESCCDLEQPSCEQYYPIRIVSDCLDPDSIWVHGDKRCNKHAELQLQFEDDHDVVSLQQDHKPLYSSLWDRVFYDAFPRSRTNFQNAYSLYEYAAFRWRHGDEAQTVMTPEELVKLRLLASAEQRLRHANLSAFSGDGVHAIAGRTLAAKVSDLFTNHINSYGKRNKLNLVFTSHEPFLAFFALAGPRSEASDQLFEQLPYHGASMVFELFSKDAGRNVTGYPSADDLYVRFLYRNSADPSACHEAYPIFGAPDACVPFRQFNATMSSIGIADAAEWCRVCENGNSCFCAPPHKKKKFLLINLLSAGAVLLIILLLVILLVFA
ncbi:hypothetical protein VTK26DRAFT_1786 [Humicola hyalothermophila]